ncbi:MAG: hypothetical protein AB7G21_06655 [Dehalococcoidia bacterium]
MTSPEGRTGKGGRALPVRLQMKREDAGTLMGALAWVLGALQIMRDRGHAESDEEFHEVYDKIAPKIERLVEQLNAARRDSMTNPEFEDQIEAAYSEVREAFEAWIQLTATDTLSMAVATRLEGIAKEAEEHREGGGGE